MVFLITGGIGFFGCVISIILIAIARSKGNSLVVPFSIYGLCIVMFLVSAALSTVDYDWSIHNNIAKKKNSEKEDQISSSGENQDSIEDVNISDEELQSKKKDGYQIGDTWSVDGQWSLTLIGVSETDERNSYSDKSPGAVYILDYTYTNIGYEDEYFGGLFISLAGNGTIVDSTGLLGYDYPLTLTDNPKRTPIGARCNAQSCIGVDNAGDFQIIYSLYDSNDEKQHATFEISVEHQS